MSYLLVFTGGGIGAVLRFLIAPLVQSLATGAGFPIGTFVVNVTGCFVIGLLGGLVENKQALSLEMRQFFMTGVLGGYTTFSTFGLETFQLICEGQMILALGNVALQVVLGLLVVWLGMYITRLF